MPAPVCARRPTRRGLPAVLVDFGLGGRAVGVLGDTGRPGDRAALRPSAARPTRARPPAVRAGQVTGGDAVPRLAYAGSAPVPENPATALEGAKKIT